MKYSLHFTKPLPANNADLLKLFCGIHLSAISKLSHELNPQYVFGDHIFKIIITFRRGQRVNTECIIPFNAYLSWGIYTL